MKKKIVLAVIVAVMIVVPVTVFAATSKSEASVKIKSFFGVNTSKLNDNQKGTIKEYNSKFAALQKEFINKMVENGSMTKENADKALKEIDNNLANDLKNGDVYGFGKFKGNMNYIDISKLSEENKKDLTSSYSEINVFYKEYTAKLVEFGVLKNDQTKAINNKFEKINEDISKENKINIALMHMNNFRFFDMKIAKLTDAQKGELDKIKTNVKDTQIKLIDKYLKYDLITTDQAEKLKKMLDKEKGFSKGKPKGNKNKHIENKTK